MMAGMTDKFEKMLQVGETAILPGLPEGYSWVLSVSPEDNVIDVKVKIGSDQIRTHTLGHIHPQYDSIPLLAVQVVERLQWFSAEMYKHAALWSWLSSLSVEGESSEILVDELVNLVVDDRTAHRAQND